MTPSPPIRVLITAGPTWEPIDAVRFLGNRSSGRLGRAVARAAAEAGHVTTLLLGPGTGSDDRLDSGMATRASVERFRTTDDLRTALARLWPQHDVLVMAAAVADFRPAHPAPNAKLRRSDGGLTLELEPTPDLLAELVATTRPDQLVIGFALEHPDELEASARRKLDGKHLDAIVANPLGTMDAATIDARVLRADGTWLEPGRMDKAAFGRWLVAAFPEIRDAARRVRPDRTPRESAEPGAATRDP